MDFLSNTLEGKTHPTGLPLLKVLHYTLSLDFDYRVHTRLSVEEAADPEQGLVPEQLSQGFLTVLACQLGHFLDVLVPGAPPKIPNTNVDYQFLPQEYRLTRKFPKLATFKAFLAAVKKEGPLHYRDLLDQALEDFTGNIKGRDLFMTKKGYIGLAQPGFQKEDSVVVLFGCQTPVILRKDGPEYELIDDCFVHGLMDGEAVRATSTSQIFVIA